MLPAVQTKILRKRLKSEPVVWISALETCFSSQSSQGWGSGKTFQVYLTKTQLVVAQHALASPIGEGAGRAWPPFTTAHPPQCLGCCAEESMG